MALVSLAVADRVAILTMERPPVNAMSRALMGELEGRLDEAAADAVVRVVVITSSLPGMFSGGADIRELEGLDPAGCAAFVALGQGLFARMGQLPKPIIAAINGVCVGGGLELAMACDLRIAARSARFGQPEVNLGVISGWGGTQRLPRLVGKTRAIELLLLAEQISAEEAFALGLVNRVVPHEALMGETMKLAQKLTAKSTVALAKVKEAVERGLFLPLAQGLSEEARAYVEAYVSGDAKEGIRAFLEKRPARFGGR
jgi:enoyl-CoA hydratase/carnithine racemase